LINCILLQNDLSGSKKLIECPNVSGSPNLKYVILRGCESVHEVDSSIFHLQKLESLSVGGCRSLKSLSSNTYYLNSMDCSNLKDFSVPFSVDGLVLGLLEWDGNELPSSILHTKNIKTFAFPICDCLVDFPENFCDYIWLTGQRKCKHDPFITLDNIPLLSKIPDSISLLSSLEIVTLMAMTIKSLPETLKYLPWIKLVDVYNCKLLQSIHALYRFIPSLCVWDCESLEEVSSSSVEPYHKRFPGFTVLLNCKKLNLHSYRTVLKNVIDGIELGAREYSEDEESWNLILPAMPMPGMENWFHYSSTQVCVTLELPSNLLGFAYYLVLSQGEMEFSVRLGCECYLDNSSGERICITSVILGSSWRNKKPVMMWTAPVTIQSLHLHSLLMNEFGFHTFIIVLELFSSKFLLTLFIY